MEKNEPPSGLTPSAGDELAERRIARMMAEEMLDILVSAYTHDKEAHRPQPKRAEPVREPLDDATLRAKARERLRQMRSGRRTTGG